MAVKADLVCFVQMGNTEEETAAIMGTCYSLGHHLDTGAFHKIIITKLNTFVSIATA